MKKILNKIELKDVIFAIILVMMYVANIAQKDKLVKENQRIKRLNKEFISINNLNDSLIHKNQVIETESEKEIKELSEQVFKEKTKKVIVYSEKISATKIAEILAKFTDSTDAVSKQRDTLYITDSTKLYFEYKNPWYTINGKVIKQGVFFDSIETRDSSFFRIAEYRTGFFKHKKETHIEFAHTNPYTKIKGEKTIILKEKKKTVRNTAIISGVLAVIITTLQIIK